jgi:hypothetical protein
MHTPAASALPSASSLPPPPPLHDPTGWTVDDAIGAFAHAMPNASEATRVAAFGALTRIFDPIRSRDQLVRPAFVRRATRRFPPERRRLVLALLAAFYGFVWRAGLLDGIELGRLLLAIERARRSLGLRARVIAFPPARPGERVDAELVRLALIAEELGWWRRELRDAIDLASLASVVAHLARHDGVPLRLDRLELSRWEKELHAAGLAPTEVERRLRAIDRLLERDVPHAA